MVDAFAVVVSETAVVDDVFLVEMSLDGAFVGAEDEEVFAVDTVAADISIAAVVNDCC